MAARLDSTSCVVLLLLFVCGFAEAQEEGCYSSGSVAGIVIATVVVTLVMGVLVAAFIWYLWMHRKGGLGAKKCSPEKTPHPEKKPPISKDNYAFDNPYFKDDDTAPPDAAEKGESGFQLDNGKVTPLQNAKASSNGTSNGHKKIFSSLPFPAVFHPSGKKQKGTVDDINLSKHLERVVVGLRGVDFTGLGFNVCGNMRDGIFVRDVLARGPASESGKISAGDRIVSVTVSFAGMVYEDALTILSYASPYEVRLEVEKSRGAACPPQGSSPRVRQQGGSASLRGSKSLFHPLYRSQSIDDLTQIGSSSPVAKLKASSKDPTPKRSQSVEASNGPKARLSGPVSAKTRDSKPAGADSATRSSTSSCDSTGKSHKEKTCQVPVQKTESVPCTKKEVKSSRFRVEQSNVKAEAPPPKIAPPSKPARETPSAEEKPGVDTVDQNKKRAPEQPTPPEPAPVVEIESQSKSTNSQSTSEAEPDAQPMPSAPPRKNGSSNGGPKRRAPAPPPTVATPTKTETSADVHRSDDQNENSTNSEPPPESLKVEAEPEETPPPPPTSEVPDAAPPPAEDFNDFTALADRHTGRADFAVPEKPTDLTSSDSSSLSSGGVDSGGVSSPQKAEKDESSSPEKRKASSLGDLTTLERKARKSSESSAILERAVSMDLQQQSIPGENLVKQKRTLKAPAFEDGFDEDKEADANEKDGTGLKRWENGLGLTNGDTKLEKEEVKPEKESNEKPVDIHPQELVKVNGLGFTPGKEHITADEPVTVDVNMNMNTEQKILASTPIRKIVVKNFSNADDLQVDEVPYFGDTKIHSSSKTHIFSPVTISIPVIKPDLTQFEKLPSPPAVSQDSSWRVTKISTMDETPSVERISVQSLYKPLFATKDSNESLHEANDSVTVKIGDTPIFNLNDSSTIVGIGESSTVVGLNKDSPAVLNLSESTSTGSSSMVVNFDDSSEASALSHDTTGESSTIIHFSDSATSSGESPTIVRLGDSSSQLINGSSFVVALNDSTQTNGDDTDTTRDYETATEDVSISSNNNSPTFSVTVTTPSKAPNSAAGFAKTLIPNELENLLGLANEPGTSKPKAGVENQ